MKKKSSFLGTLRGTSFFIFGMAILMYFLNQQTYDQNQEVGKSFTVEVERSILIVSLADFWLDSTQIWVKTPKGQQGKITVPVSINELPFYSYEFRVDSPGSFSFIRIRPKQHGLTVKATNYQYRLTDNSFDIGYTGRTLYGSLVQGRVVRYVGPRESKDEVEKKINDSLMVITPDKLHPKFLMFKNKKDNKSN